MRNYTLIRLGVFASTLVTASSSYAARDWCIGGTNLPPCNGAPGKCTRNSDGSKGGFVADSAFVEKSWFLGWNVPYIDRYAQVCETAHVFGAARILNYSQIS